MNPTHDPQRFVLVKGPRANNANPVAYTGVSCALAGVEPGKVYDCLHQAQTDAKKLAQVNGVGFVILPLLG